MTNESISILWLDDQIELLIPYLTVLETLGFCVDAAENVEQALWKAEHKQYDIIIVDLFIPPKNGIDFIQKVHSYQPDAKYVAFSSYLYMDEYRHRLNKLGVPIEMMDKNMAIAPNSPMFADHFVKPILGMVSKPKNRSAICRIVSAVDIKPGWGGVSINIKKLLGIDCV